MKRFRNNTNLEKLKKNDFDSYISEKPIYGESDKLKFRYAATGKNTSRKLVPQLITAAVILAGFIFLLQTTMDPTNSDPHNAGSVDQDDEKNQDVDERKELIADVEELSFDPSAPTFNNRNSVEELELILLEFNKKIKMLDHVVDQMERDLYLELKVELVENKHKLTKLIGQKRNEAFEWPVYKSEEELNQHFYDIIPGLKRADELGFVQEINQTFDLDSDEYDFKIEDIWYNSNGFYIIYSFNINEIPEGRLASSFRLTHDEYSLRDDWMGTGDVIYDGRVYNAIKYMPLANNGLDEVNGQYNFDVHLTFGDENYLLEDQNIPLNAQIDEQNEYSFNVPVNETISQEGFTLEIDHLKHQLGGNQLHIKHDGIKLHALVSQVNGLEVYESKNDHDTNTFDFPIGASDQIPEKVEISFEQLGFLSDEQLSFDIDTSQVDYGDTIEMDKLIGEMHGTEFYISQIENHQQGYFVTMRTESNHGKIDFKMPVPPHMPLFGDYSREFNLLKLEDENGEEVSYRNLHTTANQEDDSFGFSVPAGGETITVTLSNLLFHVNLDERLTINIEE